MQLAQALLQVLAKDRSVHIHPEPELEGGRRRPRAGAWRRCQINNNSMERLQAAVCPRVFLDQGIHKYMPF